MTIEDTLHPDLFATWLSGYDTLAIGIPGQSTACPLAIYLRETLSLDAVTVTRSQVKCLRQTIPLPSWAKHFVKSVDGQTAALTGAEARNVLALALERSRGTETPQSKRFLTRLRPAFIT